MCGRTGEASSALTLLPVRGARPRGEEGENAGVDRDAHVWDLASVLLGLPEATCWSHCASVSLKQGQGDGLCVLLGGGVWKPPWGVLYPGWIEQQSYSLTLALVFWDSRILALAYLG